MKKTAHSDGSRLLVLYATDEIVVDGTKNAPPTNDDACQHDAPICHGRSSSSHRYSLF